MLKEVYNIEIILAKIDSNKLPFGIDVEYLSIDSKCVVATLILNGEISISTLHNSMHIIFIVVLQTLSVGEVSAFHIFNGSITASFTLPRVDF